MADERFLNGTFAAKWVLGIEQIPKCTLEPSISKYLFSARVDKRFRFRERSSVAANARCCCCSSMSTKPNRLYSMELSGFSRQMLIKSMTIIVVIIMLRRLRGVHKTLLRNQSKLLRYNRTLLCYSS